MEPYHPDQNFSGAWVSLVKNGQNLWGTTGWEELDLGERHDFYEIFYSPGRKVSRALPPQPIGSWTYYTVLYDPNNSRVSAYINGVLKTAVVVSWIPDRYESGGEMWSLADQMPGGYAVHEEFTEFRIWRPAGPTGALATTSHELAGQERLPAVFCSLGKPQ